MTHRTALRGFVLSAALFGSSCVVLLGLGHELHNPAIVYMLMAFWAISAFLWPVYFIEAVRTAPIRRRRRKRPPPK